MKKNLYTINKQFCTFIIPVLLITIFLYFSLLAEAYYDPYEKGFSIHDTIQYAITYAEQDVSLNKISDEEGGDCTYFVSKCLVAGGIPMDEDKWCDDDTKIVFGTFISKPAYNTFINVDGLRKFLFNERNYPVQSFDYNFEGNIPYLPSAGDIIQFDLDLDGEGDHSIICLGYNKNNELMIASHSPNIITSFNSFLSILKHHGKIKIYYIRMTNTAGLVEVTNKYIDKTIAIKSIEVNQYLSSCTGQDAEFIDTLANRSTASTWEYYYVEANEQGEVSFRTMDNRNYLSARIDLNYAFAPITASGEKPQSWESFRIYEKDGIQYIQSQANGKWLQVVADNVDHPVKAASKMVSTWERFQINIIDYSANDNTITEKPSSNLSGVPSNSLSNSTIVSQYFWKSDFNEGWYEGEWNNGQPNGYGKLTYDDFSDGKYYSLVFSNYECKALYYEGQFSDGYRYGEGIVVYENGYKDEGTFYGSWQSGKVVFEGKRWLINDKYKGYWPITITASSTSSSNTEYGNWQSVK